MKTIPEAAHFLREHDRYLILTHRRPDGDAVGSAAALCRALRMIGKEADIFPNPQFTGRFGGLLDGLVGSGDPAGKTVISVDLPAENLLPYNAPGLAGRTVFAIDHHGSNSGYAAESLVFPNAAACGEVILSLLDELNVPLTREIADALYVAISTDTGCFCFGNTTADTFRAGARCLDAGVNAAAWNRTLFLTRTQARLHLEAYLTETAEFYAGGTVCICTLPQSKLDELHISEDEIDDISGFPRDIAGVEIGAMLRDVADGAKISLRTYEKLDASAVCRIMGGGGHRAAAGATVSGTLADARAALLNALISCGIEL